MKEIEEAIRTILIQIGEDPDREGLVETPKRVAKMYDEIFAGYKTPCPELKAFASNNDAMIMKTGIHTFSFCEHHTVPMLLTVAFAYIPKGKVVGISKIIRLIKWCSARLVIQENLTEHIVDEFVKQVKPKGCMCVIIGEHLCEGMRGVKTENKTTTSSLRGVFKKLEVRNEFLTLMQITKGE